MQTNGVSKKEKRYWDDMINDTTKILDIINKQEGALNQIKNVQIRIEW